MKKKATCNPVGTEDKGMCAGINILQNQWGVPEMNFT